MRSVRLIPREVLLGNPEQTSPRVSPDGARLAWLAPRDGVLNIWVAALDGSDARPLTEDRGEGIHNVAWAADSEHLLYLQDVGGNENHHLYAVDLRTEARCATSRPSTACRRSY
jgi:Tol biopolymer transport system component